MTSEQAVYGKSYWEIVVHAFRKNWAAQLGLWVSIAMVSVAILAPLIANDRPFYFTGTMPGEYRKSYNGAARGAFGAIAGMPVRMRAERAKFDDKTASLNDYLKRLNEDETSAQYDVLNRLRKRAEVRPETRGPWISRDVPLAGVEAELQAELAEAPGIITALQKDLANPELKGEERAKKEDRLKERNDVVASIPGELAMIDGARTRIIRDMPGVYDALLSKALDGLGLKVREMADQLDDDKYQRGMEMVERIRKALGTDFLTTTEDRKPALSAVFAEMRQEFDPDKQTFVPKTRFPLLASLGALDVFLIVALFGVFVGFGPLTWWKLKAIAPIQRRWAITWGLALAPALLAAVLWLALHEAKFETVSYKRGADDQSVVMTSSLWPVIRYRYDEVPVLTISSDADRPPTRPTAAHPFGTDYMGRDLLSRMIWGSRISLAIGFVSTGIAVTIGIFLGALAGFYRGWVDIAISRFIEIIICFPTFFLILAVVAFLPPSIWNVMAVLGFFGWMGIARLQRGEFLRLVNLDFVVAAQALGATKARIMFRHVLPNALAPVLVAASFGIAGAMLTESGLSFLGFGVQEPETSWGQILYTGRSHLDKWWTFIIPGFAIFIAVTCYNLVGDGIRDAVDPRLKS
jgi:peptide/nickel transport system permease protein